MQEFKSGAFRSEHKLPYWRIPSSALRAYAKRSAKGVAYDQKNKTTHNWKMAIGKDDLAFYRELFNHGIDHLLNAKDQASGGPDMMDADGEKMLDHLEAALWNIAGLIEVMTRDPLGLCRALNQEPATEEFDDKSSGANRNNVSGVRGSTGTITVSTCMPDGQLRLL